MVPCGRRDPGQHAAPTIGPWAMSWSATPGPAEASAAVSVGDGSPAVVWRARPMRKESPLGRRHRRDEIAQGDHLALVRVVMSMIASGPFPGSQAQAVAEHHATLGVGVDDLDGRPVAHGHDVTGARAVPLGMFGQAEVAGHGHGKIELGGAAMTGSGTRRRHTGHVRLRWPACRPDGLMAEATESKAIPLRHSAIIDAWFLSFPSTSVIRCGAGWSILVRHRSMPPKPPPGRAKKMILCSRRG